MGIIEITTRLRRRSGLLALALALGTVAPVAPAQARSNVAVAPFRGPRASRVRAQVVRTLKRRYGVINWSKVQEQGALRSAASFRRAGASLGIKGFISGKIRRKRRRWVAEISLRSGGTGKPTLIASWRSRRAAALARVPAGVRRRIVAAVARAKPPRKARRRRVAKATTSEDSPDEEGDEDRDDDREDRDDEDRDEDGEEDGDDEDRDEDGDEDGSSAPDDEDDGADVDDPYQPLDLSFGFQVFQRKLRYNEDIFGVLRPYDLNASPAIAGTVEWFPAAHYTDDWYSHIGLAASFRVAVGISSSGRVDDGTGGTGQTVDFPTKANAFLVGMLARIPVSEHFQLMASLGYGIHSFVIDDAEEPCSGQADPQNPDAAAEPCAKPEIPSVAYQFIRLGMGARLVVWRNLSARAELAYLAVTSSGEITSDRFFPRGDVGGLDFGMGLAYGFLTPGLEARIAFDLRRYFYSMNPEVGDSNVAGGAVDQYLTFTLGVGYRLGG